MKETVLTGVYMWEGTTLRVTVANRPYGKFHDFYSVSPENFGSTLVLLFVQGINFCKYWSVIVIKFIHSMHVH
jgi:hypothetical protein